MRCQRVGWIFATLLAFVPSARAAQTFKLPISVVGGTVRVDGVNVAMPFSVPITNPGCPGASAVFSAELVDGAIETRLAGSAFGGIDPEAPCSLIAAALMEIELAVPEVGGSATMVRIEAEPIEGTFSSIDSATASIGMPQQGLSRSSSVPGYFMLEQQLAFVAWGPGGLQPNGSQTRLQPLVPGDTVRFQIAVGTTFTGNASRSTQGTARTRYLFRVTVPEPSATLSVPLGALSLAAASSLRGAR